MSVDPYIANAIKGLGESLTERMENIGPEASIDVNDRVSVTFGLCQIADAIRYFADRLAQLEKSR